jgi:SAM-dependent methyltransferase
LNNKEDHPQFWEDFYLADDASWDLYGPTPVFANLADDLSLGNVCIIGSGKGYDAVMFAGKGFNVTAIDFAPSAVAAVNHLAEKSSVTVKVLQEDIFNLPANYPEAFDYVIEQTCFCAIHPSRRQEYERMVHDILKPGGRIIGLWFPLDKELDEEGPAWGTTVEEVKRIFGKRWTVEREEWPALSIEPRKGREKLIIFKKEHDFH